MFSPLEHSIVGKAREKGLLEINYHNFRENAEKARHVDDEPYGGGQGMLLRAQPIFDTFDAIEKKNPRVIFAGSSRSDLFWPKLRRRVGSRRWIDLYLRSLWGLRWADQELGNGWDFSGDYVLTGGELAAMTMIDATVRLIPEVIGKESSHQDDSFSLAF